MTSLESLIQPISHSPRLREAVRLLQQQISDEERRRRQFYADMTPEQKVEFIDGQVVLHSPARNRHLDVTKVVLKLIDTYVALHQLGTVKSEKCLCTFPRNDYEPDVVFFGLDKAATFTDTTMKFPPPDLAVEVLSGSTEANDRGVKFEDYAANQVREYWIIDSEEPFVEQYMLRGGDYHLVFKAASGRLQSEVIQGFEINVEAFFDEAKNLDALRRLVSK